MALQCKYMEYDNAYHVIAELNAKRRLTDNKVPEDSSRKNNMTTNTNLPGEETEWMAGTVVTVKVSIFESKESRDAGKDAIAYRGLNNEVKFMLNTASEKDMVEQAYDHMKLLPLYEGAIDV